MRNGASRPKDHEWMAPFGVAVIVVAAIVFTSGVIESVVWISGNALCAAAVVAGTRRRRPFRPVFWHVIAGAVATFVPYGIGVRGSRQSWLDPAWADPLSAVSLSIGTVLAVVAGVLLLPRGLGRTGRRWGLMLAVVGAVIGGVAAQWAFAQGLSDGVPITGAVMNSDVLVLVAALAAGALTLQVVRCLADRNLSHVLLLAAPLVIVVSNIPIARGAVGSTANALAPIGTHLACALCAAAALHPSMVEAARSTAQSVRTAPLGPLAWLLAANGFGAYVVLDAGRTSWIVPAYCAAVAGCAGVYAARDRSLARRVQGLIAVAAIVPAEVAVPHAPASSVPGRLSHRHRSGRHPSVASANELASSLPTALTENQFTLHYQPIVRLGDGAVVGAEALLRWTHPVMGSIPPATFIPVAERIGLLDEVGDWVIGRAFSEGEQLLERLCVDEPYISINVAPSQIERPGFVASVRTHLDRLGVAPDGYVFELTEQGMVADRERAIATITELQELGVLVAMDDIGAGNASLISLSNLDLDIVKLDRALVAGLDTSRGYRILRTAVDLLRDLGVVVIAEGIEQPGVAGMLTRLGVHYGQGFGLGRPEPLAQLVARINVSPVIDLRDSVVKPLFSAGR